MSAGARTLIVSDLHLGARLGRDVLRRPAALAALLDALDGVRRLVLLGDVVELVEGDPRGALAAAEPVLRAIGAAWAPGARSSSCPATTTTRSSAPGCARTPRRPRSSTASSRTTRRRCSRRSRRSSRPRASRCATRAWWLAPRVWATHGHYLDRHLMPTTAYGVARGALGRQPRGDSTPADYDSRAARRHAAGGPDQRRAAAAAVGVAALDRLIEFAPRVDHADRAAAADRLSWLMARPLGVQMRRASIPAERGGGASASGVDADHLVFGHVHRCGPLAGDEPRQWQGPAGDRRSSTRAPGCTSRRSSMASARRTPIGLGRRRARRRPAAAGRCAARPPARRRLPRRAPGELACARARPRWSRSQRSCCSPRRSRPTSAMPSSTPASCGRAAGALHDPRARNVAARRVTDDLVLRGAPDLIAARPRSRRGRRRRRRRRVRGAVPPRRPRRAPDLRGDRDTLVLTLADVGTVATAAVGHRAPTSRRGPRHAEDRSGSCASGCRAASRDAARWADRARLAGRGCSAR